MTVIAEIIAWVILGGSVAWLAGVAVSVIVAMRMGSRGQAGSEFIPLALFPLYLTAPIASIAGAAASFWLAAGTSSATGRIVLYLIGGILAASMVFSLFCVVLVWAAFTMIRAGRGRGGRRVQRQAISQDEMIRLIRARAVQSFTRESGAVSLRYVERAPEGNDHWPLDQAAAGGFDAYVAAALELAPDFIVEFYDHDSPAEKLYRWITAAEAEDLLARGMIKTFIYGPRRFPERDPLSGERTGIELIDHGWVRHIYVEPSMEEIMVPVARAAQHSQDGVPRFSIVDNYEPGPAPERG